MALWDRVKGQLRSVIEWENASQEELFELWSASGDEIKNASKLIVKPGQGAFFLYEGKIVAVHYDEGIYQLQTANIPFWTTLTKFMQAFVSEHKVGVYFFWQTEFLNQKWGTPTPIKYDDPVYQFPVSVRAHGNFSFRIIRPEYFFVNVVGSRPSYSLNEARRVMTERFLQQLGDMLAEAGYSYAEIDKNRNELAAALKVKLHPECDALGFELTDFRIEGTDFDEATHERIARISDIAADTIAAKRAGLSYADMQQLGALRDAAKNEGGLAGAGVGLGAGLGLGQTFAQGMSNIGAKESADVRLSKLKGLFEKGLISQEDFDRRKSEILAEI
jgi:membrane protease subunit (stomatin/prohibitin family)